MDRVRTHVPARDAVLAGVMVLAVVLIEIGAPDVAQPWTSILASVWAASVLLRTAAPFAMAVLASLSAVGYVAFPVSTTVLPSFVTLLVVAFSCGENLARRRLLAASGVLLASTYVVQIVTSTRPGGDAGFADVYLSPTVLIGAPVLAGMLLRRSRHQTAELRRLGAELEAEREAHARTAAAHERNRIARELHDVISHSVSVMVVQAGAAEQMLPPDSPARDQLHTVRSTGKQALSELRRQLGVLREGLHESSSPMPALADMAALAHDGDVSLEYDAAAVGDIPPGLALAAYRVVQESLTNARKHAAGAPVRVRVDRDDQGLSVDVVNGPGTRLLDESGAGHGLTGMAERVAMYAGRLESGRTAEGGWRVHALLPLPSGASDR